MALPLQYGDGVIVCGDPVGRLYTAATHHARMCGEQAKSVRSTGDGSVGADDHHCLCMVRVVIRYSFCGVAEQPEGLDPGHQHRPHHPEHHRRRLQGIEGNYPPQIPEAYNTLKNPRLPLRLSPARSLPMPQKNLANILHKSRDQYRLEELQQLLLHLEHFSGVLMDLL